MVSLDVWGAIAAAFLLIQCIIFNLIFVALAFGLWKGSVWLWDHTDAGLKKADHLLQAGGHQLRQGQSYLAAPFVRVRGRVIGLRAAWQRLKG